MPELSELLRIASVSSDGRHGDELRAAAEWVAARAGEARLVEGDGPPLVDGLIEASQPGAPTVVVYGHYDVQEPGPADLWESPPFEPDVRDGWIHARGVSDDKGNFYALLRAARDLAGEGRLPVNVRVLADGEEELGGTTVADYAAAMDGPVDAAVIFDAHMVGRGRPAITTGLRGLVGFQLHLQSAEREVHSGLYGRAAADAVRDLMAVLGAVTSLPEPLWAGVAPVSEQEAADWRHLPAGEQALAEAGTVGVDGGAEDFYRRVWAEPSLTVHAVGAGDPTVHKTSIAREARASLSLRLAPGQDAAAMLGTLESLLRDATPAHATLTLEPWNVSQPALVAVDHPVVAEAFAAIERATGVRPMAIRSGGSIPIAAALVRRGVPTVLSGFGTAEDRIHSPNERLLVQHLDWALTSARELLLGLGRAAQPS